MTVTVRIGTKTATFLVDTGSSLDGIDAGFMRELLITQPTIGTVIMRRHPVELELNTFDGSPADLYGETTVPIIFEDEGETVFNLTLLVVKCSSYDGVIG